MRRVLARVLPLVALAAMLSAMAPAAQADPPRRGYGFHGRSYAHFTPREHARWRGGYWHHGWYSRRYAWWWVVDGYWYPYPRPFYPYPIYVPEPVYVAPAPVYVPPVYVPPVYAPPVASAPPAQYWYYCDNPRGYYPYVPSCGGGWRAVPAVPPAAPRPRR